MTEGISLMISLIMTHWIEKLTPKLIKAFKLAPAGCVTTLINIPSCLLQPNHSLLKSRRPVPTLVNLVMWR